MKRYLLHVAAVALACVCTSAVAEQDSSVEVQTTKVQPAPASVDKAPATVPAVEKLAPVPIELAKEPVKLLGDRLSVRMPKGAEVARRGGNIPAEETMAQQETRVVCDVGSKKLVLMVYETFKTATEEMDSKIAGMVAQMSPSGSLGDPVVLPNEKGLKVTQAVFPTVATDRQVAPICSAWIVCPDKTIQVLQCYSNPKSQQDVEEFRDLWTSILKTLAPGKGSLDTKARTQTFKVQGACELTIDLPEGSVATAGNGPDHFLYSIDRLVPFGADSETIGIYAGSKAAYRTGMERMKEVKIDKQEGDLMGAKVEWRKYTNPKSTIMEAVRPFPEAGSDIKLHVFFSAVRPENLEACKAIVGTLKLVTVAKP